MPGYMNVLPAEADIPHTDLLEIGMTPRGAD
jgi:NAD/NADP transhydrogenase beta subunit